MFRLRPLVFLPASYPQLSAATVSAPRTVWASMTAAVGNSARPQAMRIRPRSRSANRRGRPRSLQRSKNAYTADQCDHAAGPCAHAQGCLGYVDLLSSRSWVGGRHQDGDRSPSQDRNGQDHNERDPPPLFWPGRPPASSALSPRLGREPVLVPDRWGMRQPPSSSGLLERQPIPILLGGHPVAWWRLDHACWGRNVSPEPPAEPGKLAVPTRCDSHQVRRRDDHQATTLPTRPCQRSLRHPGACPPGEGMFFSLRRLWGRPATLEPPRGDRRQPHARVRRFERMRAGLAAPQRPP
jgi:hypothetical protein